MTPNFDRLIDEIHQPELDPTRCYCEKHDITPGLIPPMADWKRRATTPSWSPFLAMDQLGFALLDERQGGPDENSEGCSDPSGIWLSPTGRYPVRTAAHELAHSVLDHSGKRMAYTRQAMDSWAKNPDGSEKPFTIENMLAAVEMAHQVDNDMRTLVEHEAETVALLVSSVLGYPDGFSLEHAKVYVKHYTLSDDAPKWMRLALTFTQDEHRKMLKDAAWKILSAGAITLARAA